MTIESHHFISLLRRRMIVIGILLILAIRYLLWRSLSTFNLSIPLNGVLSIGLFVMELLLLSSGMIQLLLLLRTNDRRPEADRLSQAVINKTYLPTVDILIPTYNEPDFILRRTIIGCQALDYEAKTIYLLDDTRRPEVQFLAEELPGNLSTYGNLAAQYVHKSGRTVEGHWFRLGVECL